MNEIYLFFQNNVLSGNMCKKYQTLSFHESLC